MTNIDKVADSLKPTENFKNQDELILRDHLALLRTKMANERTLFSYIRTSLYLLTAGIGILEIERVEHLKAIAYISLFFSIILFVMGFVKFYQLNKHLKSYVHGSTLPGDTPGQRKTGYTAPV